MLRTKLNKTKSQKKKKTLKRISLIPKGYICESLFAVDTNVARKARSMYTSPDVTHPSKAERGDTHTHL